ncbi:hypothetical protein ACFL2Q_15690, partial [Thermodesulfobacteriota bacterium]
FRAGLIKGMVTGKSLADATRMGAVTSSFEVEHKGTQKHKFTTEDFWTRYATNFGTEPKSATAGA